MRWSGREKSANLTTHMNNETKTKTIRTTKQSTLTTGSVLPGLAMGAGTQAAGVNAASAPPLKPKAYQVIKLGIDVHLDRYVVVRQIDGAAPQPAQRFSPTAFLAWARKQTELAQQVYSCYEAGPFGYSLHRALSKRQVSNYVVRPRDWDEYGKNVKTDKRDAQQLALHLDRYVNGNTKAFSVVRVPSPQEEQARSRSRQRQSWQEEKQRLAARGRSHALYYGAHVQGDLVGGSGLAKAGPAAHRGGVAGVLAPAHPGPGTKSWTRKPRRSAAAPAELPVGLGKLTCAILEREVCDWQRFNNRRQVASYTGMCPREDSSDQRRFQGAINKHGNPRVRTALVETAWRLIQFQPTYKPVAKWLPALRHPKVTRSKRKQIVVAIGRQFSVDWWRVRTQRCRAQDLGLRLHPAPAAAPGAKAGPPRRPGKTAHNDA